MYLRPYTNIPAPTEQQVWWAPIRTVFEKRKSLTPAGIQTRDGVARSQSLTNYINPAPVHTRRACVCVNHFLNIHMKSMTTQVQTQLTHTAFAEIFLLVLFSYCLLPIQLLPHTFFIFVPHHHHHSHNHHENCIRDLKRLSVTQACILKPVHELFGSPDSPLSDYRIQGIGARIQAHLTPANELNTPNSRKLFGYLRTSQILGDIQLPNRFRTRQPHWIIHCASFCNIILNNNPLYTSFEVSKLKLCALF